MAVQGDGVRADPIPAPRRAHPGFSGDPELASVEIGEQMLRLKVDAALGQLADLGITSGLAAGY